MKTYKLREYETLFKSKSTGYEMSIKCKAYTAKQGTCKAWQTIAAWDCFNPLEYLPIKTLWINRPNKNK